MPLEIPAWLCLKCSKMYKDELSAIVCESQCKRYHCPECGKTVKRPGIFCDMDKVGWEKKRKKGLLKCRLSWTQHQRQWPQDDFSVRSKQESENHGEQESTEPEAG